MYPVGNDSGCTNGTYIVKNRLGKYINGNYIIRYKKGVAPKSTKVKHTPSKSCHSIVKLESRTTGDIHREQEFEWALDAARRLNTSEASKQDFIEQLKADLLAYTAILQEGVTEEERAEARTSMKPRATFTST